MSLFRQTRPVFNSTCDADVLTTGRIHSSAPNTPVSILTLSAEYDVNIHATSRGPLFP